MRGLEDALVRISEFLEMKKEQAPLLLAVSQSLNPIILQILVTFSVSSFLPKEIIRCSV